MNKITSWVKAAIAHCNFILKIRIKDTIGWPNFQNLCAALVCIEITKYFLGQATWREGCWSLAENFGFVLIILFYVSEEIRKQTVLVIAYIDANKNTLNINISEVDEPKEITKNQVKESVIRQANKNGYDTSKLTSFFDQL